MQKLQILSNLVLYDFLKHVLVVVVSLIFACVFSKEEGRYFLQQNGVVAISEERKRDEQILLLIDYLSEYDEQNDSKANKKKT